MKKMGGRQVVEGVNTPDKFYYFPLIINSQCIICAGTLRQFYSQRNIHLWSVEAIVGRCIGVEELRNCGSWTDLMLKRHGAAECAE